LNSQELHYAEKWFHGKLANGRATAEQLMRSYASLPDGAFLVRESDAFVGEVSLSFWYQQLLFDTHCCHTDTI